MIGPLAGVMKVAAAVGAIEAAVMLPSRPIHELLTFGHSARDSGGAGQPAAIERSLPSTPTPGRRRINTTARVQSAIKAAQAAGLTIKRVTIAADGSVTISSQEETRGEGAGPDKAATWDDV